MRNNYYSNLLILSMACVFTPLGFAQEARMVDGKVVITSGGGVNSIQNATQQSKVAATVLYVNGEPVAESGKNKHILKKGDSVFEGDKITTGSTEFLELTMSDKGVMIVKPLTQLEITHYNQNYQNAYVAENIKLEKKSDGALISLFKGSFRAITGLIQKNQYKISTPTATIGIRGTDHETQVVLDNADSEPGGASNNNGDNLDNLQSGTYSTVFSGATTITNANGTILEVAPGQTGFAPFGNLKNNNNIVPILINKTPDIILNRKIEFTSVVSETKPGNKPVQSGDIIVQDGKTCRAR